MKTRKVKIQFLKKVLIGENKISELYENRIERFILDDNEPEKYFISRTKKEYFTSKQFNDFKIKYSWKDVLLIRIIYKDSKNED
jgi:hypothetical protein